MAIKSDFSAEEWSAIREAPHLAALVVAAAGVSRFVTFEGSFTALEGVMSVYKSDSLLLRELAEHDEAMAGQQTFLREQMAFGLSQQRLLDRLQATACGQLRLAVRALGTKAPADAAVYVAWVSGVALKVAEAAGAGDLAGIVGEKIGAAEREMIGRLRAAMSLS